MAGRTLSPAPLPPSSSSITSRCGETYTARRPSLSKLDCFSSPLARRVPRRSLIAYTWITSVVESRGHKLKARNSLRSPPEFRRLPHIKRRVSVNLLNVNAASGSQGDQGMFGSSDFPAISYEEPVIRILPVGSNFRRGPEAYRRA